MKRLVYAPKVEAYVKTDYGVIDISPYITAGGVQRKLDQVSAARFTLRNPEKIWTEHSYTDPISKKPMIGPIFHPMDSIVVILTRIQDRPVQVFTGFLDQTPFKQLFPGTVELLASCTLKKLQYTYFDPGLPFFNEFLGQYGWRSLEGGGIVNPGAEGKTAKQKGALSDSGIGELLYGIIHVVAGWPDETIYIEELPKDLIELVSNIFEEASEEAEEANKEMTHLLHEIIGTSSLGSGGFVSNPGENEFPVSGTLEGVSKAYASFCNIVSRLTGLSLRVLAAWCLAEGGPNDNPLNIGPGKSFGTVEGAAKETSKTLHGSSYRGVLDSVNGTDDDQIKAIVASPWCPGCSGYYALIKGTYAEVKVNPQS